LTPIELAGTIAIKQYQNGGPSMSAATTTQFRLDLEAAEGRRPSRTDDETGFSHLHYDRQRRAWFDAAAVTLATSSTAERTAPDAQGS
jgi:hypothetical protein